MKKRWGRETLYLMLPVLLIGGGVLLKSKNPFAAGPRRMEIVGHYPLELTPLDVWRGYDGGVVIQTRIKGNADLPAGWKFTYNTLYSDLDFVYRQGKAWKPMEWRTGERNWTIRTKENDRMIALNLEGAPKDAEEVRVRGTLGVRENYTGPLTNGWIPPKNMSISGTRRSLKLETQPFDIAIKTLEQPLIAPQVSRETKITLIDSAWFTTNFPHGKFKWENFYLHLRHSENANWSSEGEQAVLNLRLFDGDGKEFKLYDMRGQGDLSSNTITYIDQNQFSQNKSGNDLIIEVVNDYAAPRKSWSRIKKPIRVEAYVSDGTCWPTKINTILPHQEATEEVIKGKRKEFGAPAQ